MSYQEGEVIGKSGIEKVCEPGTSRGGAAKSQYDREGNLLERKDPQYGSGHSAYNRQRITAKKSKPCWPTLPCRMKANPARCGPGSSQ